MRWFRGDGSWISNDNTDYSVDSTDWQGLALSALAPLEAETVHVEIRVYDVGWGDTIFSTSVYVDSAFVTGGPDITPPYIITAFSWGEDSVRVMFNEPLLKASAEDTANYSIDQGISITSAQLDPVDPMLVHLTTSPQSNLFYRLVVSGLNDLAGNLMITDTAWFWGDISTISSVKVDGDADFIPDKKGEMVMIEGVATVEWYIVSPHSIFLQDGEAGIMVWIPRYDPEIWRGDSIRVAGEVYQSFGMTQIRGIERLKRLGSNRVPSPSLILLSDFEETYEGRLIRVDSVNRADATPWPPSGVSANILITDEDGIDTVTLRIYNNTNIDGSEEPSWPISVVGILDQNDNEPPYDGSYQILPRDLGDIITVGVEEYSYTFSILEIEKPIKDNARISFMLKEEADVSLRIYNLLGQMVTELINGRLPAGEESVIWSVKDIATGVYFVKLTTGTEAMTQKIVILR